MIWWSGDTGTTHPGTADGEDREVHHVTSAADADRNVVTSRLYCTDCRYDGVFLIACTAVSCIINIFTFYALDTI